MKRRIQIGLTALLCCLIGVLAGKPYGVTAAVPESGVHVYDGADLLSSSEEERLEAYLVSVGEEVSVGIYVLTSDDSGNGTSDRYLEDFYDAGYDAGTINVDAALIHIDMEERYVNIQAYGAAEKKISDSSIESILDVIVGDLGDGQYYAACSAFADQVEYYMNYVPFFCKAWFQLLVAMGIGAAVVAIMASNSGGRMTAGASNYMDSTVTGIRARRDDYIRTSVTKRKKPESSSGGGGHSSSGGHSHSSGGRHF